MPRSQYWPFKHTNVVDEANLNAESVLQTQVGVMEGEVKEIQMQLAAIKRERYLLDQRVSYVIEPEAVKDTPVLPDTLSNFRDEEYKDEIKNKKTPLLSKPREELIRAKNIADEERFQREKNEQKLRDLEVKLNSICCPETTDVKDSKEISIDEIGILKIQIRDMKEEVEEMKITVDEKNEQLQEYRLKYLQAQQQVEELRRQMDVVDFDNKQVSDQIQIEIQKMKMQFQQKLQELSPLPDLLKGAQIQLHEAKQLQKLAEDSSEQLSNELDRVKEKLMVAVTNLNQEKGDRIKYADENKSLRFELEQKDREVEEQSKLICEYKCTMLRLEEKLNQNETLYKEKLAECHHLLKELDDLKVETSRSLVRTKERSDSMRRYMQTQISELERQLIQSRAQSRAMQKERDEVRQRMQVQINGLQENFELVEIRLRALQNQVSTLKNSYTMILSDEDDNGDDKIATL